MNFLRRRIPTILGLLILLAGLAGGVYLVQKGPPIWFLRAEPTAIPKQVKITNISDNSLSISWITEGKVAGFIKYGSTQSLDSITVDDRDQLWGKTTAYTTHHVTLRELKPKTLYYFKIGSGRSLYDDKGKLYKITTAPTITSPPPPSDPAYGTVLQAGGSPAEGVIVYLSLANSTPLSALTKSSGNWLIALNNARTNDLTSYVSYDREASIEEIFVQGGQLGTATVVTTTKNDAPVPTITLGKSYDFRQAKRPTEPKPEKEEKVIEKAVSEEVATPPASKFSFQEMATPSAATTPAELTIINPAPDEEISTSKPVIFGKGPAGVTLSITIQSPATYSATVLIDSQGNWQWTPPDNLEPGEHTVTASYTDEQGKTHLISRAFIVLAAGSDKQPAFEASPSATATPSPTPTPTPSPSPRVSVPSTEAGVPEPGYLTPTFLLSIMGVVLTFLGLLTNVLLKEAY